MSDLVFKRIKNPALRRTNVSFLPIKDYQTSNFRGTVEAISKSGTNFKVRSTIRNTTFWLDAGQLNKGLVRGVDVEDIEVGEMYDFDVAINTYVNKSGFHTTHLYALAATEPSETISQIESDLTEREWVVNVAAIYKTDFKNTLMIEAFKVGSQGENREMYTIRYFNPKEEIPSLGLYQIRVGVYNNRFWINNKGEVSEAFKPYTAEDGVTREGQQWTVCLEASSLKPIGQE